ncbi:MAG TPA: hypothetical protein PKV35_10690 [bacterium]|nr:hypothetical protein [bacterium]
MKNYEKPAVIEESSIERHLVHATPRTFKKDCDECPGQAVASHS